MLRKSKVFAIPQIQFTPLSLGVATALTACLYVISEWVFILTKPSFLNNLPICESLFILLVTTSLLVLASLLLLTPFFLVHTLNKSTRARNTLLLAAVLVPVTLLTCTALLMLDNFTYTVFRFGIVSVVGAWRVIYIVLILVLLIFLFKGIIGFTNLVEIVLDRLKRKTRVILFSSLALLTLLLVIVPAISHVSRTGLSLNHVNSAGTQKLPNIILISADSINAAKMSVYGFEQQTTPFLEELAGTSLVAENSFSNAQGTIGSLTSMLSGKYPMDTRILASEDILSGDNAVQHLPGLLREYGYRTIQLSYSYYADAVKVNIQNGFDEANGRIMENDPLTSGLAALMPGNVSYFIKELSTRLSDRLAHIFFMRAMGNPYEQVTTPTKKFNDQEKIDHAISLLGSADQPLFIHIHWMGTHGPLYQIEKQVFSAGESIEDQQKYNEAFYYDSLLEFDAAVAQLYHALEAQDLTESTMLVITSDHSQRWSISRLPLIMYFPGGEHAGDIQANTQNLDIAPTILDELQISQPEWMAGQSLLNPLPQNRPIFIAAIPSSSRDKVTGKIVYPKAEEPFYQFGKITIVKCDQYFLLNLQTMTITYGRVSPYSGECSEEEFTQAEALSLIMEHMEKYGFDTSTTLELLP